MTMTLTSNNRSAARTSRPPSPTTRRLLMVVTGGQEWALQPEFVRGVYQIPDSEVAANLESVSTPQGTLPVVSLNQVLVDRLGMKIHGSESERTLIVLHQGHTSTALRLQSVARPFELAMDRFHRLPGLVRAHDRAGMLDSLVMVRPESTDPTQAIRWVIDPLAVLGLQVRPEPTASTTDIAAPNATQQGGTQPRGHGRLLAFRPLTASPETSEFQLCLPLSAIAEVLTPQPIARLPWDNRVLHGFLIWHARPVPVLDLASALESTACDWNPTAADKREGRILVVRGMDGNPVAIPVHVQMETMNTPEAALIRFPALDHFPHLGVFQSDFGRLVVPDLHRILHSPALLRP